MIDIILSLTKLRRTVYKETLDLENLDLRIFLRFFGASVSAHKAQGTGLGLKKGVLLGPAWLPPYTSFLRSPPPVLFFHQLRKEGV